MSLLIEQIKELENKLDSMKYTGVHGNIVDRYITCGKDGCKCKRGYKHGPYPHIQVYDNKNKLHGIYLGRNKVDRYANSLKNDNEYIKIVKELNKLYQQNK